MEARGGSGGGGDGRGEQRDACLRRAAEEVGREPEAVVALRAVAVDEEVELRAIDKILHAVNPRQNLKIKVKPKNKTELQFVSGQTTRYSRMDLILIQVSLSKYLKQKPILFLV